MSHEGDDEQKEERYLYTVPPSVEEAYESEEAVMEEWGYDWYEPQLGLMYLAERDKGQRRKRGSDPIIREMLGLNENTMVFHPPQKNSAGQGDRNKECYLFYSSVVGKW
jgi:hypothetical protein